MSKSSRYKFITGIGVAIFIVLVGHLGAELMKNVPQNIGFADVLFPSYVQKTCRNCHGPSLANRHHSTPKAVAGNCVFCHQVEVNTTDKMSSVVRKTNCLDCHKESPHHKTDAAKNNRCNQCHKTVGLSTYSVANVPYVPSKITPSENSCKNCHTGQGTYEGAQLKGFEETHHGTGIENCQTCHTDDETEKNIRNCQRCHSIQALHQVGPHVEPSACFGCHGDNLGKAPDTSKQETKTDPRGVDSQPTPKTEAKPGENQPETKKDSNP